MTNLKLLILSPKLMKRRVTLVKCGSLFIQKMVSSIGLSLNNDPPHFELVSHLPEHCSEAFNEDGLLLGQIWFCEKHGRLEYSSAPTLAWER